MACTRDSLGFAMKATNMVIDGKNVPIFKSPKTDDGTKKSSKGLLCVMNSIDIDDNSEKLVLYSDVSRELENTGLLTTLYKDGKFYKHETLVEIRNRVANKTI